MKIKMSETCKRNSFWRVCVRVRAVRTYVSVCTWGHVSFSLFGVIHLVYCKVIFLLFYSF